VWWYRSRECCVIDWKSRGIWFCKTCRKPGFSALLTGLLQCVSLYFVLGAFALDNAFCWCAITTFVRHISLQLYILFYRFSICTVAIGTTTADKLAGTSCGWMSIPLFSSAIPSRLPLLLHPFPSPLLLAVSFPPLIQLGSAVTS